MQTAESFMLDKWQKINGLKFSNSKVTEMLREYALLAIKEDRENVANKYATADHDNPWANNEPYVNKDSIINAPYPKL